MKENLIKALDSDPIQNLWREADRLINELKKCTDVCSERYMVTLTRLNELTNIIDSLQEAQTISVIGSNTKKLAEEYGTVFGNAVGGSLGKSAAESFLNEFDENKNISST